MNRFFCVTRKNKFHFLHRKDKNNKWKVMATTTRNIRNHWSEVEDQQRSYHTKITFNSVSHQVVKARKSGKIVFFGSWRISTKLTQVVGRLIHIIHIFYLATRQTFSRTFPLWLNAVLPPGREKSRKQKYKQRKKETTKHKRNKKDENFSRFIYIFNSLHASFTRCFRFIGK